MGEFEENERKLLESNQDFLEGLGEISQETRKLLESCMVLDNDIGRYKFKGFVKEFLQALKWERSSEEIGFREAYEVIGKLTARICFRRDIKKVRGEINQVLDKLRVKFVEKFIFRLDSFEDDDISSISSVFSDLEDMQLKKEIVSKNLKSALKIIEIMKEKNYHQTRNWIDCVEDKNLQKKLHEELDEFCANFANVCSEERDYLREAHNAANAIRDEILRKKVKNMLPPLYISEEEYWKTNFL